MSLHTLTNSGKNSHRQIDVNGWAEIKGNPLSKVGVFPYSGRQIDPTGDKGLDPEKIYNVYRPEEELSDPACIESFKLIPWIDEHDMLGDAEEGLTPAENKPLYGTIGEDVYYEAPYLKGNLKAFSKKLVENNKKELSIGYRCVYDIQSGIFNGEHYDVIQRQLRGNHVALVREGRAGPDVAVLDEYIFTIDTRDGVDMSITETHDEEVLNTADEAMKPDESEAKDSVFTLESLGQAIMEIKNLLSQSNDGGYMSGAGGMDGSKSDGEASEGTASDKEEVTEDAECEAKGEQKKSGNVMDAKENFKFVMKEVAERDTLVKQLLPHIGVFDHAEFTTQDVAAYAAEKLGLPSSIEAVKGFLKGAEKSSISAASHAMDAQESSDAFDDYFKGE